MFSRPSGIHDNSQSSPRQSNASPPDVVQTIETLPPISNFHRRLGPRHTSTVPCANDISVPLLDTASYGVDDQSREHTHVDTLPSDNRHLHVVQPQGCDLTSPQPGIRQDVIYTTSSRTKVTDVVRRKCFNCGATHGSAWRRSICSPGKILCNKCGLRERVRSTSRRQVAAAGSVTTSATASMSTLHSLKPPQAPLLHAHANSSYHYSYPSSSVTMEARARRYSHIFPHHHSPGMDPHRARASQVPPHAHDKHAMSFEHPDRASSNSA